MKIGNVPPYEPFEEAPEYIDPRDVEINLGTTLPRIDVEEMELRIRYEILCPDAEDELDLDGIAELGYN